MIKFWKEDFKYIKRTGISFSQGFRYTFSVRGESANYLINEYELLGSDVKVHVFSDDYITVTSKKPDSRFQTCDCVEVEYEDREELMAILQEFIDIDKRNWEDYLCDDWYKKDSRWE